GFGFTDIGAAGMQRFISAQAYALRSSLGTRVGFAVVPLNDSPDRPAIEGRVAAAIHDSQSDAAGACTAPDDSGEFDVAGASFAESWKEVANTQEGSSVAVPVGADVSVTYGSVASRGATWFTSRGATDVPPGWAEAGPEYAVTTTASTAGPLQIC